MLGYYKNEEATEQVLDKDGWLHTGDLALMDAEGNVTIKGRSKNMLLGPSGQNIYPEEIEDKLNNMPYVAESIIVQQNEKLVGLVYPDFDDAFAHGLSQRRHRTCDGRKPCGTECGTTCIQPDFQNENLSRRV